MPKVSIPFGGEYQSSSLSVSNQTNINCRVNVPQTTSFTEAALYGTAGIELVTTTGNVDMINRGSHVKDGVAYFVNGDGAYRFNSDFTLEYLGMVEGESRCSFADNGRQLMIVSPGIDGYIIDETDNPVFQKILDEDFKANGNPQTVDFIDSFFIVTTDQKKFIKSAANDGLSWNALEFLGADADPDKIVSSIVNKNRLFIGGTETIEVFSNVGAGGFPFQRVNGFIIPKGVFAPFSMISADSSFMWIGGGTNEKAAIWRLNGNDAEKISTTAIDNILQSYTNEEINTSFAWSYADSGAFFIGFRLPTTTIVFDLITSQWHERKSKLIDSRGVSQFTSWRVNSLVTVYGGLYCADSQDGRVGRVSDEIYTEYESPIFREFSIATLFNNGDSFNIPEVELICESGTANKDDPDPVIFMSSSKDARIFNDDIPRSLGRTGEYSARQIWRRLGRFARFCVLRFTFSDKCKFAALKLIVHIKPGKSRAR